MMIETWRQGTETVIRAEEIRNETTDVGTSISYNRKESELSYPAFIQSVGVE